MVTKKKINEKTYIPTSKRLPKFKPPPINFKQQ